MNRTLRVELPPCPFCGHQDWLVNYHELEATCLSCKEKSEIILITKVPNIEILKDDKIHIAQYLPGVYAVKVLCGATVPNAHVDDYHWATCEVCRKEYQDKFDVLTEEEYRTADRRLQRMMEEE